MMLMQLGAVAFYAELCEKLALYGGWSHLFYLTHVPFGVMLGTFWLPIVKRREHVAQRDWAKYACWEAVFFLWMWLVAIADFVFEWSLWLFVGMELAGTLVLYYLARPLFERIIDPAKRNQIE